MLSIYQLLITQVDVVGQMVKVLRPHMVINSNSGHVNLKDSKTFNDSSFNIVF
jgi:hypothetical protein